MNKIEFSAKYLAITYVGQRMVVQSKKRKMLDGYLNSIVPVQESGVVSSYWKFVSFEDGETLIDENEVVSVSLVEDDKVLYYLSDHKFYNMLGESKWPATKWLFSYFNR
jgi:hypothetical protein